MADGSGGSGSPHILVVDDDTRLRDLLARFLGDNGFRVTAAASSAEARSRLQSFAFDLLVLDVMMPGESGLALTEWLRRSSDVPILLLTARGEPEDRILGLERGADDYLAKPFEPRELLARLRSILRRAAPPREPGEARVILGDCRFDLEREVLFRGETVVRLTTGEAKLLKLLGQRAGQAISREELCAASDSAGGSRSIDVQIARLRRKIEPDPATPRYLHTVRGQGYSLRPD